MNKVITVFCMIMTWLILTSFSAGDSLFTKRKETILRDSPSLSGTTTATLDWGIKVKVLEVQERWVKVTSEKGSGWVFGGSLSIEKPPAENKNDFLKTSASETTASIAGRPLTEAAKQYGNRQNLGNAVSDMLWMEQQADSITDEDLMRFMKENQKGEFAP